ncbi:hypothetical protein [Kibdelosporangium philippinense]|uniref:hypothetical protein n=1 Tax=Kibdelosporangium philippinense TaxID=211113 RepID=UPI00361362DD
MVGRSARVDDLHGRQPGSSHADARLMTRFVLPALWQVRPTRGQIEARPGFAVVVPRAVSPSGAPLPADYDTRLTAACDPHTDRSCALDAAFEAHHLHDLSHHHLAFLAVRPDLHSRGPGSVPSAAQPAARRDLCRGLSGCSSPQSRAAHKRHGYWDLGQPFDIPTADHHRGRRGASP